MATRIFTYDFEQCCNLKPLETTPAGATEIARDVYRLPMSLDGAALVNLADWRGVMSTDLHVKRRWQLFFNVRKLR